MPPGPFLDLGQWCAFSNNFMMVSVMFILYIFIIFSRVVTVLHGVTRPLVHIFNFLSPFMLLGSTYLILLIYIFLLYILNHYSGNH